MKYQESEFIEILASHKCWLQTLAGNRANLAGANLTGARLIYTNLTGANLTGVDLTKTNLKWVKNMPEIN